MSTLPFTKCLDGLPLFMNRNLAGEVAKGGSSNYSVYYVLILRAGQVPLFYMYSFVHYNNT
jgi:hypothetical protein